MLFASMKRLLILLMGKSSFILFRILILLIFGIYSSVESVTKLSLIFAIVEVSRWISDWGLDTLFLREYSNKNNIRSRFYFDYALKCKIISCLFGYGISFFGILIFIDGLGLVVVTISSLLIVPSLFSNINFNWMLAKDKLSDISKTLFFNFWVGILLCYFVFWVELSLINLILVVIFWEFIFSFFIFKKSFSVFLNLSRKKRVKKFKPIVFFKESTPIAISIITSIIYSKFDIFLVDHFFEYQISASYVIISKLAEPFVFLFSAISIILYNRVSYSVSMNKNNIKLYFSLDIRFFYLILFLVFYTFFAYIFLIFMGNYFYKAYSFDNFLLLGMVMLLFFRCLNLIFTSLIQSLGGFSKVMIFNIFNFLLIIPLSCFLGYFFGVLGVVYGICAGEFANSLRQLNYLKRIIK